MEIVFTKNTVFGRDIYQAGDRAEFNEKEAKIILKAGVGKKFEEPEEPGAIEAEAAVQPEPMPGTSFAVPLPEAAEAEAAETPDKPAPKAKARAKNENV